MHAPASPVLAFAILAACSGPPAAARSPAPPEPVGDALRAPAQFAAIADRKERSQAMFVEVSRVLTHARCVNCHPPDDTPRQGEAQALHDPPVLRGPADRGIPGNLCRCGTYVRIRAAVRKAAMP